MDRWFSLLDLAPVSQLLFGTDFPFRGGADQVMGLTQSGLFGAADLMAVGRDNALRLLPARK